jgi:starch phosphorylase
MNDYGTVLPERIVELKDLASNLWWSWNPAARQVFRLLDYPLWQSTHHNPLKMLRALPAERFHEAASNPEFLQTYDKAIEKLSRTREGNQTWWSAQGHPSPDFSIAYFSAEFALHQSVPLYAGGLGVLAGDHCKEASDLGVPLVGVGLRYSVGYFQQAISAEGHQQELYDRFLIDETPLEPARTSDGRPCVVEVPLSRGNIVVAVWQIHVGRVTLYLLDTDVEQNPHWARELSARLYVGEPDARLQQEIIFGIGGVRALRELGHRPTVWHLNEGHAAFVIFERLRELTDEGMAASAALNEIRSSTLFTTHTPVAAGHDTFPIDVVDANLSGFWETHAKLRDALFSLAASTHADGSRFNMTALALRGSNRVNAVSRKHRDVTHELFMPMFGNGSGNSNSVHAVTNGVHIPTWIAPAVDHLFERYIGPDWKEDHDDPNLWERVFAIPDDELWQVRQQLKMHLLTFIREHARELWIQNKTATAAQLAASGTLLDPSALTIGFARRFTEYKRSELVFDDHERLARLLNAPGRRVQIIFAGKAHPADEHGKKSLNRIYQSAADPRFAGHVAFVDDYNFHPAHFFVQGCDIWLNNPRKPLEACGTSGMKASINGVPHLSVADGWWSEGYTGHNGWLIDPGERPDDRSEADAIYRLLEEEVVPAFYDRDDRGVPVRWMTVVKQAIRTVMPRFCARRMVKEYVNQMYLPLGNSFPNSSKG